MTGAVLKTLLLELLRDRGALAMAFILPVVFFLVFAWIFAGTSGEDLRVRLAVADAVGDEDAKTLLDALRRDSGIQVVHAGTSAERTADLVRSGTADAGLVIREALGAANPPRPPLAILSDPTRGVAASMLTGRVQRAYMQALPDVALGQVIDVLDARFLHLDDAQRTRLAVGLGALRTSDASAESGNDVFGSLYVRETVIGEPESDVSIAYYAGAVAILFALFAAVHGAISLLDEREAGIVDRVLAGPAGMGVLVRARFLFLVLQGCVQILVIFVVAWLGYGVDLPGHVLGWGLTTVAVAVAASGLAVGIVTACSSRRQAQAFSNFAILIISAIGGSMVPRFFMPPFIRDLGWFTPNTWGLEAYASVFWRGGGLADLALPLGLLIGSGMAGLGFAHLQTRRWEVL